MVRPFHSLLLRNYIRHVNERQDAYINDIKWYVPRVWSLLVFATTIPIPVCKKTLEQLSRCVQIWFMGFPIVLFLSCSCFLRQGSTLQPTEVRRVAILLPQSPEHSLQVPCLASSCFVLLLKGKWLTLHRRFWGVTEEAPAFSSHSGLLIVKSLLSKISRLCPLLLIPALPLQFKSSTHK